MGKIHKLLRLDNPLSDEEIRIAPRRVRRNKRSRPKQALGLTKKLQDTLINACLDNLSGKRDRALITLGYDTLCRQSELVALRIEDLIFTKNERAKILVSRSKTDPFGESRLAVVNKETIHFINDWINSAKLQEGFIFRAVKNYSVSKNSLHPYSVNRILKKTARLPKLRPSTIQNISGHSMRVGAAQDLMSSGFGILPIMRAGGWKSMNVVARYVESPALEELYSDFEK